MNSKKELNFKVDKDKCSKCGLCTSECVFGAIVMEDYPTMKHPSSCLECEHCVAICPQGGIQLYDAPEKEPVVDYDNKANYEQMKNLIMTRRSIRKYKNKNVDKDVIEDLCQTSMYAPTAKNLRSVHFTVIDNKDKLDKFRTKLYEKMINTDFAGNPELKMFDQIVKFYKNNQKDVVFVGAPHIVIASADPSESFGIEVDSAIALSYFELLANSKGLGTLWNGILKALLENFYPEFKKELGIPESHKIGYAMAFGHPAINYKRPVNRNSKNIHYV